MRKCFCLVFAGLLLVFSCGGNSTNPAGEMTEGSLPDSTEAADEDTLELLITETPMPRAADAMFDDFIFNFLANKRLQKERIVFPLRVTTNGQTEMMDKSRWKMEHLFMRQGYYTLLFNDDEQMSHMKDTAVSEAVVERIQLRKSLVTSFHFLRVRGAWMLVEVLVDSLSANVNAEFLTFYRRFASDSLFQVKSVNETVMFVGPDPDDEFQMMEGVITPDTWEAFAPTLPSKVLYNIVYGKPQATKNEKIFLMRGVANGLEQELRFRKVGGRWLLMKMST